MPALGGVIPQRYLGRMSGIAPDTVHTEMRTKHHLNLPLSSDKTNTPAYFALLIQLKRSPCAATY